MKKVISLCDFSNFERENCNDGGRYGFKTIFELLPSGEYKVSYKTTSHMEFCDKCGGWHDPRTCPQERETISKQEVVARVETFKSMYANEPKCWIETV